MALIKCTECGKEISNKADTCPNCGAKIKKKDVNNPFLGALCFVSLVVTSFLCLAGKWEIGWGLTFFWLVVYQILYNEKKKDDTVDVSNVKKTRNAVVVFFVLQFGIIIIF